MEFNLYYILVHSIVFGLGVWIIFLRADIRTLKYDINWMNGDLNHERNYSGRLLDQYKLKCDEFDDLKDNIKEE